MQHTPAGTGMTTTRLPVMSSSGCRTLENDRPRARGQEESSFEERIFVSSAEGDPTARRRDRLKIRSRLLLNQVPTLFGPVLRNTPGCSGQRRMNLLVPSDQIPTIVDVRCGRTDVLHPRVRAAHRCPQAHRLGRARIRTVQEPEAEAITVGRGRAISPAWLAVILNVDTEHDAPCRAVAVGQSIVTHAGEADRIVRCPARLGATDPVTRIAQAVGHRARARIAGARQTGAVQAVEGPRMEVAVQLRPDVAHVLPFAPDAGAIGGERRGVANRGAHLPAVGRIECVGCPVPAMLWRIAPRQVGATGVDEPATRHATPARRRGSQADLLILLL